MVENFVFSTFIIALCMKQKEVLQKTKKSTSFLTDFLKKKRRHLLSRLLPSTIGASGLNFSVRYGKRCDTGAIATQVFCVFHRHSGKTDRQRQEARSLRKSLGQLVLLGFAVAGFTPAAYQRRRLRRPSRDVSSRGRLRA